MATFPWPSKGIDIYGYVDSAPQNVVFTAPDGSFAVGQPGTILTHNFQLSGLLDKKFSWTANPGAVSRHATVSPLTGCIDDSDMADMMATSSLVGPDGTVVSFGFYDAGPDPILSTQDQCYVYVTQATADWMTRLRAGNPRVGTKPLANFALPGAHDAGMWDVGPVMALANDTEFMAYLGRIYGVMGLSEIALHAAINLAFTQKDSTLTALSVGVRYFDFRPGYNAPQIRSGDAIHHQHTFVPGREYGAFIDDVIGWLRANPGEIVVVGLGTAGFVDSSMRVPGNRLQEAVDSRLPAGGLKRGDSSDLRRTYDDLVDSDTRLIFLNSSVIGWSVASQYTSYSDAYATTEPGVILNAIKGVTPAQQGGYDFTSLQLQATATGVIRVAVESIATISKATSPLLGTKAMCDAATYPWLAQNASQVYRSDQLLVLLNDFCDNALADIARKITLKRMGFAA